mgnify:CR=1 FL=1|jgi:hypothetical protein
MSISANVITRGALLACIAFFTINLSGLSQQLEAKDAPLSENEIRIKNTTRWAACIPGSGQLINRKYWKAPIVWGALATSVFFICDNTMQMNQFKQGWIYETDDDPYTTSYLVDTNGNLYSVDDLENGTYLFRRYRDLSYLSFVGIYLLQIVDANVDAHMRFFDSSEDLSFHVIPPQTRFEPWQLGLNITLGNKKIHK